MKTFSYISIFCLVTLFIFSLGCSTENTPVYDLLIKGGAVLDGTFPRILSTYVRSKSVLTLEDSIRKMTSLPAQVFRLEDRGMIKEGMYADIVIFDVDSFGDLSTFSQPHQYNKGLKTVIVNGTLVVENGLHLKTKPGKILYGNGKNSSGFNGSNS